MKVTSLMGSLVSCVGFAVLAAPALYAQADVNPDHFEGANIEPFDKPAKTQTEVAAIHYNGKVTLPYPVQCSGKKLSPGKYSVSLRSDGKTFQATLKQKHQAIGIVGVVHKQDYKYGGNALLVELKGKTRELSAIQVAELNMVFEPQVQLASFRESQRRRFEELLMTEQNE
jgi:hypothetical protein